MGRVDQPDRHQPPRALLGRWPLRSLALARLPVLIICGAGALLATACCFPSDAARRGERIFNGEEPLAAQIQGQGVPLPGEATRCRNCHSEEAVGGASEAAAPALDAQALLTKHSRRNGPPSRYDEKTFCTLLRTGVDPAFVQLQRIMPRYDIDDARCAALFAYLMGR
jgi:hypothetical protein